MISTEDSGVDRIRVSRLMASREEESIGRVGRGNNNNGNNAGRRCNKVQCFKYRGFGHISMFCDSMVNQSVPGREKATGKQGYNCGREDSLPGSVGSRRSGRR